MSQQPIVDIPAIQVLSDEEGEAIFAPILEELYSVAAQVIARHESGTLELKHSRVKNGVLYVATGERGGKKPIGFFKINPQEKTLSVDVYSDIQLRRWIESMKSWLETEEPKGFSAWFTAAFTAFKRLIENIKRSLKKG